MTTPYLRHLRAGEPPAHAPNAALLIDFDNVTLGIRSDLTKELKHLLNSDIIKGKVAVSRAYADWRRYHQYIVPLSESSIDLIFAPAFGNNKKNATDIRLAIDAMELVFTRPEIGTFILLSGDSDFSMLVIKLKEYGKYVIGVGIRESASDLLIQNCDEYYSYSDLAGLTKETEVPSTQKDPWILVKEAVEQMAREGDVMRSDRLKQVMQQIDPNFDEKNAGFSRFSKFVMEAGHKGHIKITRMENGQYEVAPAEGGRAAVEPAAPAAPAERPPREDRGRRGRGRGRGRGREREERGETAAPAAEERHPEPKRHEGRREGRREERRDELTLARAFDLMRRALAELPSPVGQEALRLRMSALQGREDAMLDATRFPRLLRQAHDAEVADVRKIGEDEFEVVGRGVEPAPPPVRAAAATGEPAGDGVAAAAPVAPGEGARGGVRFRRGSRLPAAPPAIQMVGVVSLDEEPEPVRAPKGRKKGAKAAEPEGESGAKEAAPKKKAARPRGKKKVEG
ncbi:MAG TPA: NYN domain-containing protein [Gemmatimonadales bacterium]|nr:NYN domain-containing protein [Gemmatimonadales bacterium]